MLYSFLINQYTDTISIVSYIQEGTIFFFSIITFQSFLFFIYHIRGLFKILVN